MASWLVEGARSTAPDVNSSRKKLNMPKLALMLGTAAIAVGVAACGSSNSSNSKSHTSTAAATASTPAATATTPASSSSTGSHTLAISANPSGSLMFSTNTLHASAGTITIDFTNKAPEAHNFTLTTASGKVLGATPQFTGGMKSITVTLKAGTYTYYCNVPGHRQAGMQGTLTVS